MRPTDGSRLIKTPDHESLLAVLSAAMIGYALLPRPSRAQSLPETVEAIDKARVATRILFITAHPDDESSGLLAYLSRGLDADVAPLRSPAARAAKTPSARNRAASLESSAPTELLAADNGYGVHQFFTRALDTGFSKSPEQHDEESGATFRSKTWSA